MSRPALGREEGVGEPLLLLSLAPPPPTMDWGPGREQGLLPAAA